VFESLENYQNIKKWKANLLNNPSLAAQYKIESEKPFLGKEYFQGVDIFYEHGEVGKCGVEKRALYLRNVYLKELDGILV